MARDPTPRARRSPSPLDCREEDLSIAPVAIRLNGETILERVRIGAASWVVLCEDRREEHTRYRVGISRTHGELDEDALHVTLESARADFEARRALAAVAKA
jgi:hypothetical protein